ncbi:MAG: PatB family C-S lyase [Bacteroidales bacterium]|nr:PatB family C-S lyase [Bacteroidales bacterium]
MQYNFDEIINRNNTDCFKYDLRKKFFNTDGIIPMWVADMDFRTPDFVMSALKTRIDHEILGYTTLNDSFYEAIVSWVYKRHKWKIKKQWIAYTPGVVPALNLAVKAFTDPGDSIIIQSPVYFPFYSAVTDHNRKLIVNNLQLKDNRYYMDIDSLRSIIDRKTKMMILCSPHNPTGNVWRKEELTELTDFCLENNILIISDEIHADIVYKGNKHIPTAKLSEEVSDRVITLMAPSKTFNFAGLSTSYFIASNQQLFEKLKKQIEHLHLGMGNIFGNIALTAAYNNGDNWLEQLIEYLEQNVHLAQEFINSELKNIELIPPEATFLLWLDFRKTNLSLKEIRDRMIYKAKLVLSEGSLFGKNGTGFQRINIGCPRSVLESALNNIAKVF